MRVSCFVKTLVNFYSLSLAVFGDLVIMMLLGCSIQFSWHVHAFTSKYSSCNIFNTLNQPRSLSVRYKTHNHKNNDEL